MIRRNARFASGLLSLSTHLAAHVATVSRDVHAAVRDSVTAPLGGQPQGPADLVYGLVRGSLDAVAGGLAGAGRLLPEPDDEDDRVLTVRAALNGVFGDRLLALDNPLALDMRLLRPHPRDDAACDLLFIHGLCMHDRQWRAGAHPSFCDWAAEHLAAEACYLRYNTGRHVSENAGDLAALLEARHAADSGRRLVLVGHSMGGLLARAALEQGRAAGMAWPAGVTALVALGSPHQGAGLEQLGNFANRQLRLLPWSAPFTRLGNLRSAGIRDLRWGNLRDADWQGHDDIEHTADLRTPVPLPPEVRHIFVAATRTPTDHPEQEPALAGDLLVAVDRALARDYPGAGSADRLIVPSLDHMGLLWDGRVYDVLRHWLAG